MRPTRKCGGRGIVREQDSERPGEKREKAPLPLPAWLTWMAVLGAHYHELNIALPTAGSKTGRTIRKPALPESTTQGREMNVGEFAKEKVKANRESRSLWGAEGMIDCE